MAYSNARELSLEVNGHPARQAKVVDCIAVWPQVALSAGRAMLRVRDEHGNTDSIEWTVQP